MSKRCQGSAVRILVSAFTILLLLKAHDCGLLAGDQYAITTSLHEEAEDTAPPQEGKAGAATEERWEWRQQF